MVSVLAAGCSTDGRTSEAVDKSPQSQSSATSPPSSPAGEERVLVVSLDGFNTKILEQRSMPTMERLIDEGASTLNARTAVERTTTLPNHTSMLTGRPVFGPRGHRIAENTDTGADLQKLNDDYVASFFDAVHDAGLTTGLYTTKEKFEVFDRSWDKDSGARDETGKDDGRDKIDTFVVGDEEELVDRALADLQESKLDAGLLHIGALDEAGHGSEFMSPTYLDEAPRVDRLLERVVETIESSEELSQTVTLIVTADHGGEGTAHSEVNDPENYRIPFVAWGDDVASGADLYALNQDRQDPGEEQPRYGATQPVRNLDVAATVLDVLGLSPAPEMSDAVQLQ